jgi:hypothetical protein
MQNIIPQSITKLKEKAYQTNTISVLGVPSGLVF